MGITDRKDREKEDLHKSILKAAREVFLEKGYHQTSIRNIAEKIEYSPTTIYLYFKDKDAIFYALHTEGFVMLNSKMSVLFSVADPLERLKAMGRIYLEFARQNPDFYDLMFVQKAPIEFLEEQEPWKEGQSAFDGLKYTIQECMDKGELNFKNAEVGAFVIWSAMHGMCTLSNRERCKVISLENQEDIIDLGFAAFVEMLDQIKN